MTNISLIFISMDNSHDTETTVVGHSAPTAAVIVTGGTLPSSHHGYEQQRPSQQQYNNRSSSTSSQAQQPSSQSSSHHSTQPSPSSRSHNTNENCFGIVVSIKETFGFIQPLLAEDQIFFSLHGTHGLSIGDEVSYMAKSTPKGMQADNLRPLEASKKAYLQGVRGVITKEPDLHRGTPGDNLIFPHPFSFPSSSFLCPVLILTRTNLHPLVSILTLPFTYYHITLPRILPYPSSYLPSHPSSTPLL